MILKKILKTRKLNFIQNLYKIFILRLYEKTNTKFQSKIQQLIKSKIKDVYIKSSFFVLFAKIFESIMEYQMIFQHTRINDEMKISIIHYTHNFSQSYIFSEIYFIEVLINQTTFDITFIRIEIIS